MMEIKPFHPMETVLRQVFRENLVAAQGRPNVVGRDLPGDVSDIYVRLQLVPGGRSGPIQGDFVFDVETFSPSYPRASSAALAIEALILRYPRVVKVDDYQVVFDRVEQNLSPAEIFWDDDSVHRILSTYVITARR